MKVSKYKPVITAAKQKRRLVRIFRDGLDEEGCYTDGFIVKANNSHVLVHFVDDRIVFDGYSVLRIEDITDIQTNIEEHGNTLEIVPTVVRV